MRLERVEISDYRSLFADERAATFSIDLAEGMNTFVGPNNCGKSNVLRAVALALDPHSDYDPAVDNPGPRAFAHPIVVLHLKADPSRPEDTRCLDRADAYEQSVGSGPTNASEGRVVIRVAYEPSEAGHVRRELLLTPSGATPGQPEQVELLELAIASLRDAVRFVLVSSGESIRSVLEGNFREILHSVVREGLAEAFADAEQSRSDYVSGIEESLLAPLRSRLVEDIGSLFPEIEGATLAPEVPTIDRTLSNVRVGLSDLVDTPLSEKGTGVRGGVLVAMLSYLANNANRGMIFALEEPEAFLHPMAQEDLRDRLEQIALQPDVTLLVTTHSPFIVTNSPTGQVISLAKDNAGRTRISETARGSEDHAPLVAGLFRDDTFESMFHTATTVPDSTKAVVIVEGHGDRFCLELASEVVGREDLLDGIHIVAAGGAMKVVPQAIVARASSDAQVIAILDNDEAGRGAYKMLTGGTFGFKKNKEAFTYAALFSNQFQNFPVEAEDLFEVELLEAFVAEHGVDVVDGSKKRPDGFFHYDFGQSAKELLNDHLVTNTQPRHVRLWLDLILRIRELSDLNTVGTVDEILDAAEPRGAERATPTGRVLVLNGKNDYARFQRQNVLVLETTEGIPDDVTHIGFYVDGEIKPEFPVIVQHYPSLRFDDRAVEQLRSTGQRDDAYVAEAIADSLRREDNLAGTTRQLLRLSPDTDDGASHLEHAIANTKESNKGKRLAWAVSPKLIHVASLTTEPKTTTELDELEGQYQ